MSDQHMHILKTTKPNCSSSAVSAPVGEACQWAHGEIENLRQEVKSLRNGTVSADLTEGD